MRAFELQSGSAGRAAGFMSLLLAASLAGAQAPVQQPHAPLQKEGATVKVSEHVWVIPDFKVGMVPNVGIVVGSRATLVVDPGMGWRNGEIVLREARKVSRGGELYIVNTHFHPEHTTGEVAFPADAKVLRAAAQQQDVEQMGMTWVKRFAGRSPELAKLLADAKFRAPAEVFEKEKVLDLGGVRVRLIRLGPGHTRGDTVAFVEGDGVLFSGDLAMKALFPAFSTPQSRSDTWLASLDVLERLQPRILVPAHYDLTDASTIASYRGFLTALRARAAELKKQGVSAAEAGETLRAEFTAKYPDWHQPQRIGSAVAAIYRELP